MRRREEKALRDRGAAWDTCGGGRACCCSVAVRTSGAGGREVSDERGKSLAGKKEGGSVAAGGWFVVFTVTFA